MIPSRCLLVVVVLLSPLISSLTPPSIDLTKFIDGDGYFIRKSCELQGATSTDINVLSVMRTPKNNICDVVMHTRKRGESNLLIEIEIQHISSITGSVQLDKDKSIKFIQGPFEIECKPTELTVTGSDISFDHFVSYFSDDRIFCSFVLKSKNGKLDSHFEQNPNLPELHFHNSKGEQILKHNNAKDLLWSTGYVRCDPDLAGTVNPFEENGVAYSKVETNAHLIDKCAAGKLYVRGGCDSCSSTPRIVNSIECDKVWNENIGEKTTTLDKPFEVICGIRHCSQCTDSTLAPFSCPSCSKPQFAQSEDQCSNITCSSTMWILDGKWVLNPTINCKRATSGNYAWQHNGIPIKEGACTTEYDCFDHSKLEIAECDDGTCKKVNITNSRKTISCESTYVLKFGDHYQYNAKKFECDTTTGSYKHQNGTEDVPSKSKVACLLNKIHNDNVKEKEKKNDIGTATGSGPLPLYIVPIACAILTVSFITIYKVVKERRNKLEHEREIAEREAEKRNEFEEKRRILSIANSRKREGEIMSQTNSGAVMRRKKLTTNRKDWKTDTYKRQKAIEVGKTRVGHLMRPKSEYTKWMENKIKKNDPENKKSKKATDSDRSISCELSMASDNSDRSERSDRSVNDKNISNIPWYKQERKFMGLPRKDKKEEQEGTPEWEYGYFVTETEERDHELVDFIANKRKEEEEEKRKEEEEKKLKNEEKKENKGNKEKKAEKKEIKQKSEEPEKGERVGKKKVRKQR